MNKILGFLNSHASVRQFTDDKITDDQLSQIIATAQRSPTSSNLQAYSIVSIRETGKKRELAELCGRQAHISQSSIFLVFLADLYRLKRITEKRGYPFTGEYAEMFTIAIVDTALAAGRALMAAQALGFGGVMVGGIRNNIADVSDLLKLPEFVTPVMGMSLGKPVQEPKQKPRLPQPALHFAEEYSIGALDSAIADYDETVDKIGYLKGREIHPQDYPGFAGDYSWSEHTARRMSRTEPSTLRPHMLPFLRSKGFLKK